MSKKFVSKNDPETMEIMDKLVKAAIEKQAGTAEGADQYWKHFQMVIERVNAAEEAIKAAKDCCYGLDNSSIKEALAAVESNFAPVKQAVEQERERINQHRYSPLKLQEEPEDGIVEEGMMEEPAAEDNGVLLDDLKIGEVK